MKTNEDLTAVLAELVDDTKIIKVEEVQKALAAHKDVLALGPQTFVRVIASADDQVARATVKRPANGLRLRAEVPAKVAKKKRAETESDEDDKKKQEEKKDDKKT